MFSRVGSIFFFFNDTATTEIYTLSLHDALPISSRHAVRGAGPGAGPRRDRSGRESESTGGHRSEEHTSELQSRPHLVCRLLLEKKKQPFSGTVRILRLSADGDLCSTAGLAMQLI